MIDAQVVLAAIWQYCQELEVEAQQVRASRDTLLAGADSLQARQQTQALWQLYDRFDGAWHAYQLVLALLRGRTTDGSD